MDWGAAIGLAFAMASIVITMIGKGISVDYSIMAMRFDYCMLTLGWMMDESNESVSLMPV